MRTDSAAARPLHIALGDNAVGCLRAACGPGGMPTSNGRHYVATSSPAELIDLFASRRELSDNERISLSRAYS